MGRILIGKQHHTIYKTDNQQGPTVSTGNCTQYSVITHMGKESKKNAYMDVYVCMCVCVTESLCYTPENNTL